MLEILSVVIEKLIGRAIDSFSSIGEKKFDWKRTAFAQFIEFYSSLVKLEEASIRLYDELSKVAEGKEPLVKIILRDRLRELFESSENFINHLRRIENILSIYKSELLYVIKGTFSMKFKNLKAIELFTLSCPNIVEKKGRPTEIISYPSSLPDLPDPLLVKRDSIDPKEPLFPSYGSDYRYERPSTDEVAEVKKRVIKNMKIVKLNLADLSELKSHLKKAQKDIQIIQKTREKLAEFIKEGFPIDKLIT